MLNPVTPTPNPRSYRPEVIADSSGQWCGNGLRFATESEAFNNARDLSYRWTLVRDFRAAPSPDPVTHSYHGGQLVTLTDAERNKLSAISDIKDTL